MSHDSDLRRVKGFPTIRITVGVLRHAIDGNPFGGRGSGSLWCKYCILGFRRPCIRGF